MDNDHTSELTTNRAYPLESPPCSVLIVDDDAISQQVLRRCLLRDNPQLQIEIAASGETALCLFQKKRHPIIFLNLFLPDTNGFELHPRFRQAAGHSPIAIIGHTVQLHRSRELLQAGFTGFLPKPFAREELQCLLQQIAPIIKCRIQLQSQTIA